MPSSNGENGNEIILQSEIRQQYQKRGNRKREHVE
jgi:hypothetical protein